MEGAVKRGNWKNGIAVHAHDNQHSVSWDEHYWYWSIFLEEEDIGGDMDPQK